MYMVTASSKIDGTAASATQRPRRVHAIGSASASIATRAAVDTPRRHTTAAHVNERSSRTTYPTVHSLAWSCKRKLGSTSSGYAISAMKLPLLLAAYRKYGSPAAPSSVAENHFCSSAALVDSTKNGRPIDPNSAASSQSVGLPRCSGGA